MPRYTRRGSPAQTWSRPLPSIDVALPVINLPRQSEFIHDEVPIPKLLAAGLRTADCNLDLKLAVGQADAGLSAGGTFAVEGGFWGGAYAVQSIGAPLLSVTGVGTNAQFTWLDANASFVLESANSLTPPVTWSLVPNAPVDSNGQRSVTLPGTSGVRFYRLRKM